MTGVSIKTDYILCFWVVHEVTDMEGLFAEIMRILKSDDKIFVIEPKIHVSKYDFEEMISKVLALGFEIIERPRVFFSRGVVFQK
jgi:hypothetical protein